MNLCQSDMKTPARGQTSSSSSIGLLGLQTSQSERCFLVTSERDCIKNTSACSHVGALGVTETQFWKSGSQKNTFKKGILFFMA